MRAKQTVVRICTITSSNRWCAVCKPRSSNGSTAQAGSSAPTIQALRQRSAAAGRCVDVSERQPGLLQAADSLRHLGASSGSAQRILRLDFHQTRLVCARPIRRGLEHRGSESEWTSSEMERLPKEPVLSHSRSESRTYPLLSTTADSQHRSETPDKTDLP